MSFPYQKYVKFLNKNENNHKIAVYEPFLKDENSILAEK